MHNRIETREPDDYICGLRFTNAERESLRQLSTSGKVADRRRCVAWIEPGLRMEANVKFNIEVLARLASDPRPLETLREIRQLLESMGETEEDPKSWRGTIGMQALSWLGELAESWPGEAWPAIERLAHSRSHQVRELLPAFVLEHFLGAHYEQYFPLVKEQVEGGDNAWLELLNGCYRVGKMEHCEAEIDELLLNHGLEPHNSYSYGLAKEYDDVFPRMREAAAEGNWGFLHRLKWCYLAGQANEHRHEIEGLLREHNVEPHFTKPPSHSLI